jgi:hypothetical protein
VKARTKEEWIEIYRESTGEEIVPAPHLFLSWHPEHGAMTFIDPACSEPGVLEIVNMVGDGKFWSRIAKKFMRSAGLTTARLFTRRNPGAVNRRFGLRVVGYTMEANIDDIKDS